MLKCSNMDGTTSDLPDSIDIRSINPEQWRDYEFLRHTMLKSNPEAFSPQAFGDLKKPENEWIKRINEGIVLIAYDGISPVGMIQTKFNNDISQVCNLYISESIRGKGLERKLLENLLGQIQDKGGIRNIELEVEDTQGLEKKIYESFGFYETKREPQLRIINGEEIAGCKITMKKAI